MLRFLLPALLLVVPAILTAGRPPHILMIMADDLGWGDVGFHGGTVPTPHLDQLAAESLEFERFYVFPSCSPTRAAVLTGKMPHRLGISAPVRPIDPGLPVDTPTLPAMLQQAGYHTAMIGKWHLSDSSSREQRPHHRGFDQFYGSYRTGIDYFTRTNANGESDWWLNDEIIEESGYITHLQAAAGERLIRESDDIPLFLFFAVHAPHSPQQAPTETVERFSHLRGRNAPTYAAMVSEFDTAVGQLLTAIDESGQRDHTIVIFFSDNGGLRFADRGDFRGNKNTLYEGGIRAPFTVRWPGVTPAGATTTQLAVAMDLMPTLLAAAGVEIPESLVDDGANLMPSLDGKTNFTRDPVVIGTHEYALVTPRWKLLESSGALELYDLTEDPSESRDLAAAEPEVVEALQQTLNAYVTPLPIFETRGNRQRRN